MANGDKKVTKRDIGQVSVSVVLAWASLAPPFWFLLKPVMVEAVGIAVASDIQAQVEYSVQPLNSAFQVLLQLQIDEGLRHRAALEHRRSSNPATWTAQDAQELANCKIQIAALEAAKNGLDNGKDK